MLKLSILIPTIHRHAKYFIELYSELLFQKEKYIDEVEILVDRNENDSIGSKRNRLLERANGEYIIFCDSDDTVSENYLDLLMHGIENSVDCCSLKGMYSIDGVNDGVFEHSIKYGRWETVSGEIKYLRYPNHLNCIKATIAKQFKFPENNFGEDKAWSDLIHESGLIKNEHYIPEIIYHYKYLTNKN